MASSSATAAANIHHHQHGDASSGGGGGGSPAPPPPTPSNQTLSMSLSTDADAALSRFLNQLLITPSLSLSPTSRFSRVSSGLSKPSPPAQQDQEQEEVRPPHPQPPVISLIQNQEDLLLSAASDHGFFHLMDHGIPSHLPASVILESNSLFLSSHHHQYSSSSSSPSPLLSSNLSTLGFNYDDEDDENDDEEEDQFLVFDVASDDLDARPTLKEYARCLERVGLEVVEMLSRAGGFSENPVLRKQTSKPRCLMWVSSSSSTTTTTNKEGIEEEDQEDEIRRRGNKCYPYVVSLQYEMRSWSKPCWLLGDDGFWLPVDPHVDSLLVTVGDIAQVWSNGRFKKVRGRPQPSSTDHRDSPTITMSLLVTLPMDTIISPLRPLAMEGHDEYNPESCGGGEGDEDIKPRFSAFPLEEYAWRIYREGLPYKDPLLRNRI